MDGLREHRVYGPPGTGKTTYLARQCQLAAQKYGASSVMVASLTRAAAQEVAGRETGIPKDNIGTLHAHAYRAMERPTIAESKQGLAAWNAWIKTKVPTWQIDDPHAFNFEDAPLEATAFGTEGAALLADVGVWRARMVDPDLWPPRLQRFWAKWCEWKKAEAWADFTDLLERCLAEVSKPPCHPKIMFLDEAQDFSKLELSLARKWGSTCEQLVIVGDPDQNLYQWRGSDPEVFTEGEPETKHVLSQSYRVPPAVHAYAVQWIEKIEGREPIAYEPAKDRGAGEVVRAPGRRWKEPLPLVLNHIERDLDAGLDVMILASCTFMLPPLIRVLRERGIPFHNPYRETQGAWNPLRGAERLRCYLKTADVDKGGESKPWTWEDVQKWVEPLKAKGVLERGMKTWIDSKAAPDLLGSEPEIANLDKVLNCFEAHHRNAIFNNDVKWWFDHLLASRKKAAEYPVKVFQRRGGEALRAEPHVVVGTIHSVKGGQADSVYVFPDLSRAGYEVWQRRQGRDAIYRQFYVAFTRSKLKLTLCGPSGFERVPFPAPKENT